MQRGPTRVVLLTLLGVCACATPAGQSKKAASIAHGGSAAQDTTPTESAEKTVPVWREMTWPEYYDSVMRNARKRGATVVWINPPEVRKVDRAEQPRTK